MPLYCVTAGTTFQEAPGEILCECKKAFIAWEKELMQSKKAFPLYLLCGVLAPLCKEGFCSEKEVQ